MNPNSAHQTWALYVYEVRGATKGQRFDDVLTNCLRFGRKAFGSAAQLRVIQYERCWEVRILAEGYPVDDAAFTTWMHRQWEYFFKHGFGPSCVVKASARLMAGQRSDGKPADQMIIVPSIPIPSTSHTREGG